MSDRTVTVRPSGGDYTSLNAAIVAEVAANADLTSDNGSGSAGILFFKYESDWSGGGDTTIALLNGFTTSASYYPHIYTDSANRASSDGLDTSKVILDIDTNGFNNYALSVTDADAVLDGLQVRYSSARTGATAWAAIVLDSGFNANITIKNCYLERGSVGSGANLAGLINPAARSADIKIINVISNGFENGFVESQTSALSLEAFYYNCLAYGATNGFYTDSVNDVTFENCVSFQNTTDFNDSGTGTMTVNFCASDDNTGTNNVAESGGGADWPDDFNDAGNGDFSKVSGSNLIGAGTDLSGIFTDDINGNTRSAWDVSADEFQAGGTIYDITGTDGVELSDSASALGDLGLTAADGVLLSDTGSILIDQLITAVDGVKVSDQANVSLDYLLTAIDGVLLSDVANQSVDFQISAVDGVKVSDVAAAVADYVLNSFDGVVVSDLATFEEAQVDGVVTITITMSNGVAVVSLNNGASVVSLSQGSIDVSLID